MEYGTKGYSGTVYRRRDAGAVGGEHTVNRDRSQFSGRNRLGRRATKNKSDGENFFGYYPDIPARPAHPWLRPSIDMNRDDIRIIIRGAIDSTLARAAKGRSMADPGFALQRAIYQRLSAELTVPVFDAVPDDTLYPYVTIDREVAQNTSPISGRKRKQRLIYLSVWSDHQGQAEVRRILNEIDAALDERHLSVDEGRAVSVRVIASDTNREPDGRTYMGSATVRVITTS